MYSEAYILYPHQLFESLLVDVRAKCAQQRKDAAISCIFLVEDPLFFSQFTFHKAKILFHRASMKVFEQRLKALGYKVFYFDVERLEKTQDIARHIDELGVRRIHYFDLVDDWLESRLKEGLDTFGIEYIEHTSPAFYLSALDVNREFVGKTTFFMGRFYIQQRKRLGILLDNGGPTGGHWSYDAENRKKIPKSVLLPTLNSGNNDPLSRGALDEARKYVEANFSANYGTQDDFIYPIHHAEAKKWLDLFLRERFYHFGEYQDAMLSSESYLFHSVISPLLNVGLLLPTEVIDQTLQYAHSQGVPLNSLEGFIRQIIGWREFVRGVYRAIGRKERTRNFFGHKRKLPTSFWTGKTGIVPIDEVIQKVLKTGYAHHIERLMILCNFMLLCEIDPEDVYKWFMELFIDAYDWVMVPNVYGMGLFADGGMITTKPYLSGSNYILKMSNFEKGPWAEVWNSLYWNFLHKNRVVMEKNHRMRPILLQLSKMSSEVITKHKQNAALFLKSFV